MRIKKFILMLLLFPLTFSSFAQDDLENMLEGKMDKIIDYSMGTFISNNILNNQSTEMLNKNGIGFRISHKFGKFNFGSGNFYGFDDATTFMGINYGVSDWLNVGIGRATYDETINGFTKFRVLRQSTGGRMMPFSLALLLNANYKTKVFDNQERNKNKVERLEYSSQLLLSRKFNSKFSAQVMPNYIHRNLVETKIDQNDIFALGFGVSYKIIDHFSVNAEYFWVQDHDTPNVKYYKPVSFGICYQTSRHEFELFATNSQSITDNNFIANTTYDFWKGDIRIGFNISTVFTLSCKK